MIKECKEQKRGKTTKKKNNQRNVIYVDLSAVKGNKIIAKGGLSFDDRAHAILKSARYIYNII